jgi:hypothetical protein
VQAFTEQQLVHVLQLAQGESGRQKAEGDWGLIEPALNRFGSSFDHPALPWGEWRKIPFRKPGIACPGGCGLVGDERNISDGHIRITGMALAVTERADLLHPDWRLAECVLGDSGCGRIEHFACLGDAPRKGPSFSLG